MPEQETTIGDVVLYRKTTTRWYIATIHALANDAVTLEYLSGDKAKVNPNKISSFKAFLRNREKAFSRTREDLCEIFYRRKFDRLPKSKIAEMQGFFRQYGVRYSPDIWPPEVRIRIELDDSFVAPVKQSSDSVLDALLPRWLEPNRLPPGSRDPLGFQSHAENLANTILPGFTVFTSRVGYYAFIAWAVEKLNREKPPLAVTRRECFHRLERALALCEFIHHGQEERSCSIIGQRSKSGILQSAVNNCFHVPARILKNQDAAGAFRLYTSSLESMGFALPAPELAAEGLLPLRLTPLGNKLADEYKKRVPDGFWNFALSDKAQSRDTLREWGKKLCFSRLGKIKLFRDLFLKGFLLGSSREAEARHYTVRLLFQRGLLRDNYEVAKHRRHIADSIAEDDIAGFEEESEEMGLANRDALIRFYGEKPKTENALLQRAAVFELLSLAQTAIFAHAINAIESAGHASITGLADSIASDDVYGALWKVPFSKIANKAGSVSDIEKALMDSKDDPARAAALAGVLMARVQAENAYGAHTPDLADTPVMVLLGAIDPDKSLAEGYADLLQAMVARHEQVSKNKSRRCWCHLEAGEIVKDDLRRLGYGWHAMRFPQLWSICRDLSLTKKDVFNDQ